MNETIERAALRERDSVDAREREREREREYEWMSAHEHEMMQQQRDDEAKNSSCLLVLSLV
mgnify:CR=1 FL=1